MTSPLYIVGTAAVTENLLKRKWSTVILRHMDSGVCDPAEVCRLEPGLTPPALNERLRTMMRYSLVTRYPRRGTPRLIEYRLTLRGQKMLKMLTLIEQLDELTDKNLITLQETEPSLPPAPPAPSEPPARKRPDKRPLAKKNTQTVLQPST